MKKRIVKLSSLVMLMILIYCNSVCAKENIDDNKEIVRGNVAVLTADTGEEQSFEIKTETVAISEQSFGIAMSDDMVNNTVYCKEFSVNIPAKAFGYTSQMTDEAWDKSGGVKAWGRVYFEKSGDTMLVTGMEGNWRVNDGGVSLYNHKAIMGTSGEGEYSNRWITQRIEVPVSAPFNIQSGFNEPVRTNITGALVGGTTMVDISRGNSHWNLILPLVLVDNGIPIM